jgi:hypothetical protein
MLPGPTHELEPMFEKQVLPRLRQDGLIGEGDAYVQVRTCGLGESAVEQMMQPIIERHSAVVVAYCMHYGIVDVRLACRDGSLQLAELKLIAQEARQIFGPDFAGLRLFWSLFTCSGGVSRIARIGSNFGHRRILHGRLISGRVYEYCRSLNGLRGWSGLLYG